MVSFINQALKDVTQNENIEMLEKYQSVTKEQVIDVIKRHVLPVFDPKTSVAIVVTAPSKFDSTADALSLTGYDVEKRTLEVEELDGDAEMEGSESGSSCTTSSSGGEIDK